jgi:hypothetical protein
MSHSDIQEPVKIEPTVKAEDTAISEHDSDDDEVGPMPPSAGEKRKATAEEEEEDEFGFESDEEEVDTTPISHEIVLKDHTKVCIV